MFVAAGTASAGSPRLSTIVQFRLCPITPPAALMECTAETQPAYWK
jgi:hypothetical protein